ncbi:phosphotransferase family protein [Lactobacillus salivarius]|nr:phosphotransferase family protein [Ligilactobacillus salivarius]NXZ97165.1 phosphotransferase family protein [Ligilactobacillus salivarius]NYA59740.1 phosphotransferase family protein [Ligilactobacillus salivarius]NYA60807.1 phosphotransferase family protein [Ligilactobacillus salivarius]NYA62606.1 phosphotransferase family protein [Ligilactobacillus salivarius]NYA67154.1 phosphotransferase family protein [Ligilactobacillus salivarius]
MNLNLENGWQILPIGGDTDTAYMGIKSDQKVFLKRNTSPFLAALSLEEIAPRLIWTKRISTGDTLTAQEWLNGRSLYRSEMGQKSVSDLLYKVHHTPVLKKMLIQVGGKVVTPIDLVRKYFEGLPDDLNQHPLLNKVANYLKANQPDLKSDFYEVCHGDLNHKNWLLSDKEKLYLVDWESARIADPASDLSMLMCQYVPRKNWEQWLRQYGLEVNRDLWYRIYWYSLINLLLDVKYYHQRGRFTEMNQDILKISELMNLIFKM